MSIAMCRNGERVRECTLIATTLAGNYATRSDGMQTVPPYRRSVTVDPRVEYFQQVIIIIIPPGQGSS